MYRREVACVSQKAEEGLSRENIEMCISNVKEHPIEIIVHET